VDDITTNRQTIAANRQNMVLPDKDLKPRRDLPDMSTPTLNCSFPLVMISSWYFAYLSCKRSATRD